MAERICEDPRHVESKKSPKVKVVTKSALAQMVRPIRCKACAERVTRFNGRRIP